MTTRAQVIVALLMLAALGCRSDLDTWQAKLAASNAPHLVGLWNVQLRLDNRSADSRRQPTAAGQIALTLNNERVASPGFGEPPMVVGTYDVDFGPVGLAVVRYAGFPGVVGRVRGDSVDLKFASQSKLPVELTGVMAGDSIVGRWDAHSRAGPDGTGDFVLHRR